MNGKAQKLMFIGSLILAVAALSGCAGTPEVAEMMQWPAPPLEPRIVYESSIAGSESLDRSFWGKINDFFFGKSQAHALGKPYGVALDAKGRLLLADTATKRVIILDFKSGHASTLESLGPHGRLAEPVNILPEADGTVIVADTGLQKLVVFDAEGRFDRFLGEGHLVSPVGMVRSRANGQLYVVDAGAHQVVVFAADGQFLHSFGGRGDMQGEFYHPLGITITADDLVYVVDSFHFAVQIFDLAGQYVGSFGPVPTGMGSLARPRDVAFDSDGNLYVTDGLNNNVQVFSPDGVLLLKFGSQGYRAGQFRLPAGICVGEDDRIYVVDSINKRVQVFRYLPETKEG